MESIFSWRCDQFGCLTVKQQRLRSDLASWWKTERGDLQLLILNSTFTLLVRHSGRPSEVLLCWIYYLICGLVCHGPSVHFFNWLDFLGRNPGNSRSCCHLLGTTVCVVVVLLPWILLARACIRTEATILEVSSTTLEPISAFNSDTFISPGNNRLISRLLSCVDLLAENGLDSIPLGICFCLIIWDVLDITWDSCRSAENTRVVGASGVNLGYSFCLGRGNFISDSVDYGHWDIVLVAVLNVLVRNKVQELAQRVIIFHKVFKNALLVNVYKIRLMHTCTWVI